MLNSDKHIFAVYLSNLSELILDLKENQTLEIKDKELYNRLIKILRLINGDNFVLFDETKNVELELLQETFDSKKNIFGKILQIKQNQPFISKIFFCPFLLKKSSFESVIYTAAQMGVGIIQPILGQKVQKKWWEQKEVGRLKKIMVSACEQSKNFVLPELCEPVSLDKFLDSDINSSAKKVFFDPEGQPFLTLLNNLNDEKTEEVLLMFGPEGGLTELEEKKLKESKFDFIALTPTMLRSIDAVILGLGGVRSVLV